MPADRRWPHRRRRGYGWDGHVPGAGRPGAETAPGHNCSQTGPRRVWAARAWDRVWLAAAPPHPLKSLAIARQLSITAAGAQAQVSVIYQAEVPDGIAFYDRSEEHTSELQSHSFIS